MIFPQPTNPTHMTLAGLVFGDPTAPACANPESTAAARWPLRPATAVGLRVTVRLPPTYTPQPPVHRSVDPRSVTGPLGTWAVDDSSHGHPTPAAMMFMGVAADAGFPTDTAPAPYLQISSRECQVNTLTGQFHVILFTISDSLPMYVTHFAAYTALRDRRWVTLHGFLPDSSRVGDVIAAIGTMRVVGQR